MNLNEQLKPGFTYYIEHERNGAVLSRECVRNLMPTESLNHIIDVTIKGGTQVPTWYIGLYEGNYTPISTDTAATFPASATECTTYDETARVAFDEGSISGGSVSNSASKAEFTSNSNKTVYGGFITSAAAKGATSGKLLSAVKFASPKTFNDGDILRVTAGLTFVSA